jgi:hypothetical protein
MVIVTEEQREAMRLRFRASAALHKAGGAKANFVGKDGVPAVR